MFEAIRSYLPPEWRPTFEFLAAPVWWLPEWQERALAFVLVGGSAAAVTAKAVLLLPPLALLVVGLWATLLGLYTVPFRARRRSFLTDVTLTWWDAGRSIWLYWAGLLRLAVVVVGWAWGTLKLVVSLAARTLRAVFVSPMRFMDWSASRYFQPGVPWIAFLLTLGWSALEATIFTFTLMPTLRDVIPALTGFVPDTTFMLPVVWLFLFFLIAGSFACIQALAEAVSERNPTRMVEMTLVEVFVMFFEVVFLYRELVSAVTPWIAQQTGGEVQLGLWATLAVACFGWIGIRGMTWFLFGRFGTPALLAVLSRETMGHERREEEREPAPALDEVWEAPLVAFREERAWFREQAREAYEMASLPILQLLAAAVNFPVVVFRSEPVFQLPLTSLEEMLDETPFSDRRAEGRGPSAPAGSGSPAPAASGSSAPASGGEGGAS